MVAAVVGIRLRTAGHLLRREWWRALVTALGVVWMLAMLPSLGWSHLTLTRLDVDLRGDALVVVALVSTVGWAVVPLVVASLDDTLDPSRFRPLGVDARRLMPGLTVAAFLTLPVLFFAILFTVLGSAWRVDGAAVLATALAGLALTLASIVIGARLLAAWAGRVLASRRARAATAAAIAVGIAAIVPLAFAMFSGGLGEVVEQSASTVIRQAGLTPLGAGADAPRHLAHGDAVAAAWRLAMQAGWVALLLAAWRATVAQALVSPPGRSGSARRRHDAVLDGHLPPWLHDDGAAAAVHVRLRRAWATDPRYLASLAGVAILPIAFVALVIPAFDLDRRWAYAVPLMLAASIGWGRHNDVAFDSSGLWLDVVSGRLGRAIMRGRLSATALWATPLVVGAALGLAWWARSWDDAPGLVGAAVGVLGLSLGVAAVSAVVVPYRAPLPGHSPFSAEVGSVGAGLAAQVASSLVLVLLLPGVLAPFVLSLTVAPAWGWLALALGVLAGVGAYLGGVRFAGTLYDRRSGALLSAVT